MRANPTAWRNLKRLAALALCIGALSACVTEQDARLEYRHDFGSHTNWPGATYYTVVVHDGDTLSQIAARYDLTSDQVARMNDIRADDTLYVGQVLRVPPTRGSRSAVLREATNNRLPPAPAYQPDRRVIVKQEPDITPRRDAAIVPRPAPDSSSAPQSGPSAHAGDTLVAGFTTPVSGKIILDYGDTGGGQRNDGINIAASAGTPIHAAADGVVSYAGNELKGYGNLILIKHGDDYVTAYAHTANIGVARGQRVSKGDVIGTVGQTGDVDQPQLHFEIRRGMKPINPHSVVTASRDS